LPKDATSEAIESRDAMKAWVYRDWPGAVKAYGAIVAKHPDDMDAAYHLGMSQVNAGEVDKGLVNVERAIKSGRSDTRSQVAYARTLLVAKRYPESIAMYERVLKAGVDDRGTSRYNLACAYALNGKKDEALKALELSINEGFNDVRLLKSDEDLASLRGEDQFAALVKRVGEKG
jgi:tetratricopeptide (TPR) repeat protein